MADIPQNIQESIEILDEIIEDTGVPKNVRALCEEVKMELLKDEDTKVKIDSALQKLDTLSDNIQIPSYTRMQIWNIVSILESQG